MMIRTLVATVLAACLLACASEAEVQRPEVGATPEKIILAALTKVAASDTQRLAVLNSYDNRNGQLLLLARQSRQIVNQWHALDRTAADFPQQVDALAAQWAELNASEMKTRAAYERDLATQLTPKQWSQWQDFMRSVGEAQRRAELFGDQWTERRGGQR